MSHSWRLGDSEQFCLTLSLNRSPAEIIRIYGADEGAARQLLSQDTPDAPPLGTVLRSGSLGEWGFCIEFEDPIGFTNGVMRDLSIDTESIILFRTAKALTVFHCVVNGRVIEWFAPGYPPSVRGHSSHQFSQRIHALTSAGMDSIAACLDVIARCVGQEITTEILRGSLLSVIVDEPDRDALERPDPPLLHPRDTQENPRPLGRPLPAFPTP
ncbi:DUF6461 domain-containing protein [Streptomyces sp. NRRL F-5630]|uniref:DUF6461 domain-containing protein n=1 Tax=Streptomyces sp. NRRL F-5630 TaxID=1463864 RepID=UPI003D71A9EC